MLENFKKDRGLWFVVVVCGCGFVDMVFSDYNTYSSLDFDYD